MEKEKKAKIAASAVAAATGVSILVGGLFQSPADLARDDRAKTISPPAYEYVMPVLPDDDGGDGGGDDGEEEVLSEEKRRGGWKAALREQILRLPWGVRAFIGVPLWAVGFILLTGLSALWSAVLSPVMGTVVGWACTAAVILAIVFCSVKAAFPDLPVKKILNRKTVPTVIIGVAAAAAADALLPLALEHYDEIRNAFRVAATSLLAIGVTVPQLIKNRKTARNKAA